MNDHREHIFGWMKDLWNKWRGHLHAKYVKDKPIQQTLKNIPKGVDKKEWEWLVKEHFSSESFQASLLTLLDNTRSIWTTFGVLMIEATSQDASLEDAQVHYYFARAVMQNLIS